MEVRGEGKRGCQVTMVTEKRKKEEKATLNCRSPRRPSASHIKGGKKETIFTKTQKKSVTKIWMNRQNQFITLKLHARLLTQNIVWAARKRTECMWGWMSGPEQSQDTLRNFVLPSKIAATSLRLEPHAAHLFKPSFCVWRRSTRTDAASVSPLFTLRYTEQMCTEARLAGLHCCYLNTCNIRAFKRNFSENNWWKV